MRMKLPTGTVTFMFTDIEGSTRLVRELGERYREVLGEHDRLLRAMITEHGGVEVSTEGDAFFAVFSRADAAVAAAVGVQRTLERAPWASAPRVRVRIGLHVGEGVLGGNNYTGLDVHVAARVAAAGHGGQVLVTDAIRAGVGDAAADIGFRDLGAFRLKDLEGPIHLYQLVGPGLATAFPPPKAGRSGSLPEPRTPFIGRRVLLDELEGILGATRLLVLTGPGGTGKTRLGLELGRRVRERFVDGTFFVPLEATNDAQGVASAILDVLEMPLRTQSAHDVLRDLLAGRQLLLVLDNLEQVEGVGELIDDLLGSALDLTIVATSRRSLRVYGAHEFHVPPLGVPAHDWKLDATELLEVDSVALFVDRAKRSGGTFELTGANAESVAEICRRLDGLPLAIELAAARTRLLAPAAILARLDAQLKLLEDNAPNLPVRQRSLRGAIAWSYDLLDDAERRLLRRLSAFSGGWNLEAAAAVAAPDDAVADRTDAVLDGIAGLLDQSLVGRADTASEPRFTMLTAIRHFGRERLIADGERDDTMRRHADHMRAVLEAAEPEFTGGEPGVAVARMAPDQENVHAALDWCIERDQADPGLAIASAGWRMWQLRGQLAVGRQYLDALLSLPSAQEVTPLRARALTAVGGVLYWQGDPATASRYAEALHIFESLHDEAGIAEAHSNVGFAHLMARPPRLEEALREFTEGVRRYEAMGDRGMVASLTGAIGYAHMALGNLTEGRDSLERALELNLAGGFRARAADNRFALGNLAMKSRLLADAAGRYRLALRDAVEMEDRTRTRTFLAAVAGWAAESGKVEFGLRLTGALRRAADEEGGVMNVPAVVEAVEVAHRNGMPEEAIAHHIAAGELVDLREAVRDAMGLLDGSSSTAEH